MISRCSNLSSCHPQGLLCQASDEQLIYSSSQPCKVRTFVPVLRSDDLLESHSLDVTWSLLSAAHALHRLCQHVVVLSLGQILVLRESDLSSSESLQKKKQTNPKGQTNHSCHPRARGHGLLIWDARKSQGGGGLLSPVQEERGGLNEPGCFCAPGCYCREVLPSEEEEERAQCPLRRPGEHGQGHAESEL